MADAGAIVLAAGRSERMGGSDKLLQALGGRPVIAYSLACFAACAAVDAVVVVASASNEASVRGIAAAVAPEATVTIGGERRRDSVAAGLSVLPGGCEFVVVHDGARPLLTPALIEAALAGARRAGAAVCGVAVSDTVKRSGADGYIRSTVSREGLWLAQTPQAFRTDLLRRAHAVYDIDATDDAALVEMLGEPILVVPGSARNLKITTPEDLALAEALLRAPP